MDAKVSCMVTGATGVIGRAISRALAAQGLNVVMLSRNKRIAEQAVEEIRRETGNDEVHFEIADVSIPSSIADLRKRWQGPLNVLINNAAVTPPRRELSMEGLELQFATNILGYVRMMKAFEGLLSQSERSRVVNVASYWAGDLDLDDIQFKRRHYQNNTAYRQSKQANRMLSVAFADRWKDKGISVNACHPGDVSSKLSNNLGFGGHETPDSAAETPVWLATHSSGIEYTGKYFENQHMTHCPFSLMHDETEQLYQYCMNFC